jgi:hypothetical protein
MCGVVWSAREHFSLGLIETLSCIGRFSTYQPDQLDKHNDANSDGQRGRRRDIAGGTGPGGRTPDVRHAQPRARGTRARGLIQRARRRGSGARGGGRALDQCRRPCLRRRRRPSAVGRPRVSCGRSRSSAWSEHPPAISRSNDSSRTGVCRTLVRTGPAARRWAAPVNGFRRFVAIKRSHGGEIEPGVRSTCLRRSVSAAPVAAARAMIGGRETAR